MNTSLEHKNTFAVAFEKGVDKGTKMHRMLFSFFIIFNALLPFIAGETGCPDDEDIAPCKCIRKPAPRLFCNRILNPDILLRVFTASERYTFQEVSTVQYSKFGREIPEKICFLIKRFDLTTLKHIIIIITGKKLSSGKLDLHIFCNKFEILIYK